MTKAGQSARIYAKHNNIDIQTLLDILSFWRPYDTTSEMMFIKMFVDTIPGIDNDECGNRFLRIPNLDGTDSNILWSCHTDTVHSTKGCTKIKRQNLMWDATGNIIGLNQGSPGQCLGADDGAGMWLLMEMIKENIPGLYIFHRGEEKGGIGSKWIEKNTPELLDGIEMAIAFDRKALTSVITHQRGGRCCSDEFGLSMAEQLGLNYKLDTGGSFTDTAVYIDLVGECTNISCGYYNEHGPRETVDVSHVIRLRHALLHMDTSKLVVKREPGEVEPAKVYNYNSYQPQKRSADADKKAWGRDDSQLHKEYWDSVEADKDLADPSGPVGKLESLISRWPQIAAKMLAMCGLTAFDFADQVMEDMGLEHEEEESMYETLSAKTGDDSIQCNNCYTSVDVKDALEDNRCPFCYDDVSKQLEEAGWVLDKSTPLLEDNRKSA